MDEPTPIWVRTNGHGETCCLIGNLAGYLVEESGFVRTDHIPQDTKHFSLESVNQNQNFVEDLIAAHIPSQLIGLSIGGNSESPNSFNYVPAVTQLGTVEYPELKFLSLGDYELHCNQDPIYGDLGLITPLLNRCPLLRELSIQGMFDLVQPFDLPELQKADISFFPGQIPGVVRRPTQLTVNSVFRSPFPRIEELLIDFDLSWTEQLMTIDLNSNDPFQLAEEFLANNSWRGLREIEISGRFAPVLSEFNFPDNARRNIQI